MRFVRKGGIKISNFNLAIKPIVHYSESKSVHESNSLIKPQAHSLLVSLNFMAGHRCYGRGKSKGTIHSGFVT